MKHIFVSYTFENMHSEREIVQNSVIPMLSGKAKNYGGCIEYVDLRWENTVDYDKISGDVFDALNAEIIRKQPFILVFVENDSSYNVVKKMVNEYKHLFICVKKSSDNNSMLSEFKDKIIFYSSVNEESFKDGLLKKLTELVEEDFKKNEITLWQEKESYGYKAYIDELCGFFNKVSNSIISFDKLHSAFSLKIDMKNIDKYSIACFKAREKTVIKYEDEISNNNEKLFLYLGESGCGKSFLYANLVHKFEKSKKNIFPFVCKYSLRSTTASDLLKQIVYFLENLLGIKEHFIDKTVLSKDTVIDADFLKNPSIQESIETCDIDIVENRKENDIKINYFNDWKDYFVRLLKKYDERYSDPFIILLDCVEQFPDNELEQVLNMIPFIEDDKVKCVMFGHESINFDIFEGYEGIMKVENITKLTARELGDISEGVLKANDITLDNVVIDTLLKKEGTSNPLYLNLLLYYLVMECREYNTSMAKSDKNKYLMKLIEKQTSDIEKLIKIVMDKAASKYNKVMIKDIVRLIAVSRNGLRESDIESIVNKKGKFNKQEFIQFISYMSICFELKEDGRYDFSHEVFKNCIKNSISNEIEYEKRILNIIKELPFKDELRLYDGIYHAYNCGDKDFVVYQMELACIEDEEESLIISNSIKHICYMDEGKWLCDIVGNKKIVNDKSVIIPYLLHDFRKSFDKNVTDNTIRMNLMKELVVRLSNIYKKDKSALNQINLISSYRRIGSLMRSFENIDRSIECYTKALELAVELNKKDVNAIDNEEILNIYGILGEIYLEKKKFESANKYFAGYLAISIKKYFQVKSLSNLKNVATAYKQMGMLYKENKLYDNAKQSLELFIECIKLIQKHDEDIGNKKEEMLGYYLCGEVCRKTRNKEGALTNYDYALKCSKKVLAYKNSISARKDVAISYARIGDMYSSEGKTEQALMYQEKSLEYMEDIYDKIKDSHSLKDLLISSIKTSRAYLRLEEYEKALECGNRCLELAVELNSRHSNDMWNIYEYSVAQELMGDIYEAKDLYYEALEFYNIALYYKTECLYIKKEKAVYRSISEICSKMAYSYSMIEDYHNSIIMYQRKMKYIEELNNMSESLEYYKDIVFCYSKLSDMCTKLNDIENAVAYSEKEVEILQGVLSYEKTIDNMSEIAKCYDNIADNFYENEKYESALYYYQKEMKWLETIYVENNDSFTLQSVANKCERIGDLYVTLGRHETALEYYKKEFSYVSTLYEILPDFESFKNISVVCNILGDAYERLDLHDEALNYFKKGVEWIEKLGDFTDSEDVSEMFYYAHNKIDIIEGNI